MSVYSPEDRKKAVDLYLKNGGNASAVCRELGYASSRSVERWLREFQEAGSNEYLSPAKKYLRERMKAAVKLMCSGGYTAEEVAENFGVNPTTVYRWKKRLLGKEYPMSKRRRGEAKDVDHEDVEALRAEVQSLREEQKKLKEEKYWLQLEVDVLKVTAEILKKGRGADPKKLTNREKAKAIGALKTKYPLSDLLKYFAMAKSSYFYQRAAMSVGDKYTELRERVRTAFNEANGRYGYRRIHVVLTRDGGRVSEKVIRRLMREENLVVVGRKRRKYNSYLGEISPPVPNIIQRDFHAEAPNTKWLTDITEFRIPAGRVYLAPTVDCFDGMAVSWSIGKSPSAELVNSMLESAVSTLREDERPVVHSDCGSHYRWPGWIAKMEETGLTRSMSRKGCSPDNAACEGFFGHLKTEFFYGRSWIGVSVREFMRRLDTYLRWHNEERIKMSLGGRSPLEYRRALGYA
jgi:transposase InsO family protein/transposase-like protein